MKHKIRKVKIRGGKDANDMLVRKLSVNFLAHGHLTTTKAKAKVLKTFLDRLLNKVKEDTQSNRTMVYAVLQDKAKTNELFANMTDEAKKINGSFLSTKFDRIRTNDGSQMYKVSWAHEFMKPVVKEEPAKKVKAPKAAKAEKPAKTEKSKKEEVKEKKA